MADKLGPTDVDQVSHDEKHSTPPGAEEPQMADTAARRGSLAMNIVENPLTVSFE